MTTAKTGNAIVDGIARARSRAQADERRAKASAKKAAGKSKGGKFRGAGKAGRAAAARPAKGISAKRLSRKSSGMKTAQYGLKDGAELIASNCGYNVQTIAAGLSPQLRHEIKNQIERLTFSTPASSGKATAEQWRERVEFIRQELGIDDSFSHCASRHTDQEHDHIHMDFNRVNDEGRLWADGQIGLRLAALEEKIEQKFGLKLTQREDFLTTGNLSKDEIERATREGVQPTFLQVQAAIQEAKKDRTDVLTFVARLSDKGIACRPNLKQGELNGFSYKLGDQSFTGKQVGANWNQLKNEVNYEPDKHLATLTNLKKLIDEGKTRPDRPAYSDTRGVESAGSTTPSADGRAKVAEAEPSALETQSARPDRPPAVSPSRTRLADSRTDGTADRPHLDMVNADDPIIKKIKLRQAIIDRLRRETGERRALAVELATRMEREDLYRQREAIKTFIRDHGNDPQAVGLVKECAPDLVPAAPEAQVRHHADKYETPPATAGLPERLKLADRYVEPTPQNPDDHLPVPSM